MFLFLTRQLLRNGLNALLIGSLLFVCAFLPKLQFAANTLLPLGNTITLNSTSEAANPTDGLCTLREAITAANTNTVSGVTAGECAAGSSTDTDTIDATGIAGLINLTTALPAVSSDLKLNGPASGQLVVQRPPGGSTPRFRIFTINSGTVEINNLTIAGGLTADGTGPIFIGDVGGGILNNGTLTLDTVIVAFNQTGNGAVSGGAGGGIYNAGTLTIIRSSIKQNTTGNGGNGGSGGGILNSGTLTVINGTIAGNQTGNAGSGSQAGGAGGAIYNSNSGTLNLTNTTISGNFTGNGAAGSLSPDGGGIKNLGTTNFRNTIVANNTAGTGGSAPDLSGTFNSQDYNLIENSSGSSLTGFVSHNVTGLDPNLGPLNFNGGLMQTLSPLPGSPAIDAGDNCVVTNSCSPALPLAITTDQRGAGFIRPADGNGDAVNTVDIGAFEVQSFLVTNTNDSGAGSLRQALTNANADAGTDAINFQAGLTGTISAATILPDISTSMAINGPGQSQLTVMRSTAGGTPNFRIFGIGSGVTASISGLTMSNGNVTGSFPGNTGGGIFNGGTLTLSNATVSSNTASASAAGGGGGIFTNGTLTVNNSIVSGNTTGSGPGGGIFSNGLLTVTNSTVSGNVAGNVFGGGGVYNNSGITTLINTTVSGNSSFNSGGLGNNSSAIMMLANTTVSGNTNTGGDGAGIFNFGNIILTNATLSGNTSTGSGGGFYNGNSALANIINSTISGNHANASSNAGGGGIYNQGTVFLKNTIVANNTINNGTGPDLRGSFGSQDYNLIANTSAATFTGTTTHDLLNQSANLGALANNGGSTQTMLPLPGSPAINAGDPASLPADTFDLNNNGNTSESLPVDQRGFARVIGANFDIGAVETNYSITATSGSGQSAVIKSDFSSPLQATVQESNMVKGGISVTFATPGSGASATFPGSIINVSVITNASGIATSPTLTANGTAGGPYSVVASLASGLGSASFSLTNLKANTAVALTSSVNPSAEGEAVTFTATVTSVAGTPTGTVQFKADALNVGSPVALTNGVATIATSSLAVGTHTITADYSGDANFNSSSGSLAGGQTVGGILQFSQSNYMIDEGQNFLSITVTRTGNTAAPATVKYATSDATDVNFICNPNTAGQITAAASRKCDYHIAAGRLRFAAGETSKVIVLSIVNDVYVEGAETLTISLSSPTGAVLGSPNPATVTITDNDTPGQANPIDATGFYVRMLYVDLLSREPDPAGFAGWVHRIDFCGQPGEPPPPCDRVTVGGDGFLRSAEFFDREFFVIRLYRTALGRILRYDDVGDLAYVSGFLTDADLELNKQELVTDIMARSEFASMYNSLSNSQYVDTMISTAAVTLPAGVRDGWVNALNGATKTRAQVFRELSERAEVSAKYLHEAQVVSCYYGFFTRNPDGAYFNFVQRLDNGEITLGDLANAFINAAEYRQRFGP